MQLADQCFFEMCEWGVDDPWKWGANVSNAWRATGDHHDNWGSTAGIINNMAGLSSYAGEGHWNYMDFLMTGGEGCKGNSTGHCPGMKDVEYRTEFSLWTICNSGLLVATDIRDLTPIMKELLFNTEVIAVNQDSLKKAGDRLESTACGEVVNTCQVWGKPVVDGYALVFYNAGSKPHPIPVDFNSFGWKGVTAKVRDLWAQKDIGSATDTYTADNVPSHGVVFVKLTK